MSTVEFDGDNLYHPANFNRHLNNSKIVYFLLKKGVFSNESQANKFFVILASLSIVVSILLISIFVLKFNPFSESPKEKSIEFQQVFEKNASLFKDNN
jgi:hypothetical protein